MSNCYKEPFLEKVIVRIDFSAHYDIPAKGLNKKIADEILKIFPIPEPLEVKAKKIIVSANDAKNVDEIENQYFYHGKNREKKLLITSNCMFIEVLQYETFDKLRNEFSSIVNSLYENNEFSVSRFGLRYINNIKLNEPNLFEWDSYIDGRMLCGLNIIDDKKYVSRIFSNVVQNFEDGLLLNFNYGISNPDFPSPIRQKHFILDFDGVYQGLIQKDELTNCIDTAHSKIEEIFEDVITDELRAKMKIVADG